MEGYKTVEVFDVLADHYGMGVICSHGFDYENAIFSNGFILAMESGMMPVLGTEEVSLPGRKNGNEFHHVILNDECYKVYFEEVENEDY